MVKHLIAALITLCDFTWTFSNYDVYRYNHENVMAGHIYGNTFYAEIIFDIVFFQNHLSLGLEYFGPIKL